MSAPFVCCAPIKILLDSAATDALGAASPGRSRDADALLLAAPVGARKTVLPQAFVLAATDAADLVVPSPGYTLVQRNETRPGKADHFDLWRLHGPAGLAELGPGEALAEKVLVKWPEWRGELRPARAAEISRADDRREGPRGATLGSAGEAARFLMTRQSRTSEAI